jgi:hypothetical protein
MSIGIMTSRFDAALTLDGFIAEATQQQSLWQAMADRARPPEDLVQRARGIGRVLRLLILTEDWCGDAVTTVPVVVRLAEHVGWAARLLRRDEHLDVMDAQMSSAWTQGRAVSG